MKKILLLTLLIHSCIFMSAEVRVGIGRKVITPQTPIWLSGYASRNKPSTEKLHDLWAKAIVIEQNKNRRIIIVTTDLLGLPHDISEDIANKIIKKYGISRSQLLLNSSHTHSGPVIRPTLSVMYELKAEDQLAVSLYSQRLPDDIVDVIDMAMNNLEPVQLSCGHGTVDFAVNRREPTDKGFIIGVNPCGPVDHDVPVLRIAATDGKLKAVVFGYACHNTTSNTYLINGDYAGFAQIELEKANPGTLAMFLMGCGADQNPLPRGSIDLAGQHGKSLADAVLKVLSGELCPVHPPIRTDFKVIVLDFLKIDTEVYKRELLSTDRYRQRRAKLVLEACKKGLNVSGIPLPVQAVRFNNDFTILAIGGEVVVDYSLAVKREYPEENLFVAGYCNEVPCYIPSRRILSEGGYEPEASMIYYGLPGPFADNVEDKVFSAIYKVMKRTGARHLQ